MDMIEPAAVPISANDHQADPVTIIVEALRQKFGADADEVARRQVEAASGDTLRTWLEIRARLSDPEAHP
jgi:hypothetical protein